MTPDLIALAKACADIQQRCEAATLGPWVAQKRDDAFQVRTHQGHAVTGWGRVPQGEIDAEFIAHAREDIPYLLRAAIALAKALIQRIGAYDCSDGGHSDAVGASACDLLSEASETIQTMADHWETMRADLTGVLDERDALAISATALVEWKERAEIEISNLRDCAFLAEQRATALDETGSARLLPNGRLGCIDCGEQYGSVRFPDPVIDHAAFARIAPNPPDGGLICPNCINARLEKAGFAYGTVRARFTSGPMAVRAENEVNLWRELKRAAEEVRTNGRWSDGHWMIDKAVYDTLADAVRATTKESK